MASNLTQTVQDWAVLWVGQLQDGASLVINPLQHHEEMLDRGRRDACDQASHASVWMIQPDFGSPNLGSDESMEIIDIRLAAGDLVLGKSQHPNAWQNPVHNHPKRDQTQACRCGEPSVLGRSPAVAVTEEPGFHTCRYEVLDDHLARGRFTRFCHAAAIFKVLAATACCVTVHHDAKPSRCLNPR